MAFLKLSLLGPLQIKLEQQDIAWPRRKVVALLAYLVQNRRRHQRDALATLLWPDLGQRAARSALRREIYVLTTTLGDTWFLIDRESIGIDPGADLRTDVEAFQHHLATSRTDTDITPLKEAAALYRDDFLGNFVLADCPAFNEWVAFVAEGYRHDYAALLQQLVAWHEEKQRYEEATHYARKWLALDAMHEPAHRALMRLFAFMEQPTAAERQYAECKRILQEDLDIQPSTETTALYYAIRNRQFPPVRNKPPTPPSDPSPPETRQPRRSSTLPTPSTPFVGRQEELAAIQRLLCHEEECRLLTLIGPGGIGKTRVSLAVAHQLEQREKLYSALNENPSLGRGINSGSHHNRSTARPDGSTQEVNRKAQLRFPDGIYFIALAAISEPEQMIPLIAETVGCRLRGTEAPLQQLATFLAPLRLLIVIDNFEHLLDSASTESRTSIDANASGPLLIKALLEAAPALSILVTSREALALAMEWLYPLGGLATPAADAPLATISANNAVQLFVQRAQRVARTFALTAENASEVVRICHLVDGMPLGLELAASWLQTLTVTELADEIASNLDILATELRNIPERHRSLRAVFEQTWQRLRLEERQTLCRLAIFRGPFTRDAAATVANASLIDISSLVERSLCRYEAGRYDIHELLRQFAQERLAADDEATIRTEHSTYFGALAAAQHRYLVSAQEGRALQVVANEYDNLVAAWHHMLDTLAGGKEIGQWTTLLQGVVPVLAAYFEQRTLFWEGDRIFQNALMRLQTSAGATSGSPQLYSDRNESRREIEDLQLLLQVEQAGLGMHLGRYQEAKSVLVALLQLLRMPHRYSQLFTALNHLGLAHIRTGEFADAELYTEESLSLNKEGQHAAERAVALINRGVIANSRHQLERARQAYQAAAEIFETLGYATGHARCLSNIGSTYLDGAEELRRAASYYEQAYQIAHRSNSQLWAGVAISNLGFCAYELEDYEEAVARYREGLAIFRQLRDMRWIAVTLADVSYALVAQGNLEDAATSLTESLRLVQLYQLVVDGLKALMATALVLDRQQIYEPAVALATHVVQDERTRTTARRHGERFLATVVEDMPTNAYTDAQFFGQSTPFPLMVQYALEQLDSVRGFS